MVEIEREMSLLSLPCELIELVCLEANFDVLKELFRSRVVPLLDDEVFWARKAHKDSGFPKDRYGRRSLVEQEIAIPNFLMIRYVEVVSRRGIVSDSMLFLSLRECLRRAVKIGNESLISHFKGYLKHKSYTWSDVIFGQALRNNNRELFEPLINRHRGSSFDFLLGLRHIPVPRQSVKHMLGWICSVPCQTIDEFRNVVLDVGRDAVETDRDMLLHCTLIYHNRLDLFRQLDYTAHRPSVWEMVGSISSIELYRKVVALIPFDDEEGEPDPCRDDLLMAALEVGRVEFIKEIAAPHLLLDSDEISGILLSSMCLELMEYVSDYIEYRDDMFRGCSVSINDVNKISSLAVKKLIFRLKDIEV